MPNEKRPCIRAEAKIGSDDFMRFSLFDTFVRRRAWRSPAIFAGMLLFSAFICFFLRHTKEQAMLLFIVLLSIGLVLPTVYVVMYIFSVRSTAEKLKLGRGRVIYTLEFDEDELRVSNEKENASFPWAELHAVYFDKKCLYIYPTATRAFLLPACGESEEAAALLRRVLDADKCKTVGRAKP